MSSSILDTDADMNPRVVALGAAILLNKHDALLQRSSFSDSVMKGTTPSERLQVLAIEAFMIALNSSDSSSSSSSSIGPALLNLTQLHAQTVQVLREGLVFFHPSLPQDASLVEQMQAKNASYTLAWIQSVARGMDASDSKSASVIPYLKALSVLPVSNGAGSKAPPKPASHHTKSKHKDTRSGLVFDDTSLTIRVDNNDITGYVLIGGGLLLMGTAALIVYLTRSRAN